MHKPFHSWTNFFRRLGLTPGEGLKPFGRRHRTLRMEQLTPRQMLSADIVAVGFQGAGDDLVVTYDV